MERSSQRTLDSISLQLASLHGTETRRFFRKMLVILVAFDLLPEIFRLVYTLHLDSTRALCDYLIYCPRRVPAPTARGLHPGHWARNRPRSARSYRR